jgi:sporulation protein YlmC with PRC-barrel domain
MTKWLANSAVLIGLLSHGYAVAQTDTSPSGGTKLSDAQCEVVWARIAKVTAARISPAEAQGSLTDFKAADTDSDGGVTHAEFLVACSKGLVHASAEQRSAEKAKVLTSLPSPSVPISHLYGQNVYDPGNNEIGDIKDILLSPDGRAIAAIVGVGGFLGIGERNVGVPFDALKQTTKDNKTYLTLDATKDQLRSAPGFRYDRSKSAWVSETSSK